MSCCRPLRESPLDLERERPSAADAARFGFGGADEGALSAAAHAGACPRERRAPGRRRRARLAAGVGVSALLAAALVLAL